jgi:hypothetical protein
LIIFSAIGCGNGSTKTKYITLPPEEPPPDKSLSVNIGNVPISMAVGETYYHLSADIAPTYDDKGVEILFEWISDCGTFDSKYSPTTFFTAGNTPGKCTIIVKASDGEFISFAAATILIVD